MTANAASRSNWATPVPLLHDFGVARTARWRYDSKCRKPLQLGYTGASFTSQGASDWPELLIPESYRDRLDEFAADKTDNSLTPP